MTPRADSGIALLEVLVALVILSTAGVALVGLVGAGLQSERDARSRERILVTEERLIAAMTLLNREDLDRRIGRHPVGEFVVHVERPERTLYRIVLAEVRAPEMEDLVTVVYRPERPGAP